MLPEQVRLKLLNLAPQVLFLGTRYVVHMLVHNRIVPIGDESCALTFDPERAAAVAAQPAAWDSGRGSLLALDFSTFPRDRSFMSVNRTEEFACRDLVLSRHLLGVYWLDELVPRLGLHPVQREGSATIDLIPYSQVDDNRAGILEDCNRRRVNPAHLKPLDDTYDWGAFGYIGTGPQFLDDVFLLVGPGDPDAPSGSRRNARHFLHPDFA